LVNLNGREGSEDQDVDANIILQWIFEGISWIYELR
jgi:hypothetical protein